MQSIKQKRNHHQSGFTLIEVGIASVLAAALTTGIINLVADYLNGQAAQVKGQQLAIVNGAVAAYEQKYVTNLQTNTAIPVPGFANVANIYAPTTTELYNLGLLAMSTPAGTYGVSINHTLVDGSPTGLTWLVAPITDSKGRPDQALAGLAMTAAGGDAAMSTASNPAQVTGADGWFTSNPESGSASVLAMRNGMGATSYMRTDGSTPMQGTLNLAGNSITNVNNVGTTSLSAASVTTNSLAASGTITSASVTSSGNISSSGNITAAGAVTGAAIATNGNLSGGAVWSAGGVTANGNISGPTLTATSLGNDVFFGSSALYSDGWSTVIRSPGGSLYVQDFSGNALPVVASKLQVNQGNGVQIGNSYFYGDGSNSAVRQNGELYVQNQEGTSSGNLDAHRMTAEEYIQVEGTAQVGGSCSPNGLMAQDGTGAPLFCINGTWGSVSSSSSTTVNNPTPTTPAWSVTPANVDFGYLSNEYDIVQSLPVVIYSTGTAAVTITGLSVNSPLANGYSRNAFTTSGCSTGQVIQPGGSCTVNVTFETGNNENYVSYSGTLTINSNAGSVSIPLTGSSMD